MALFFVQMITFFSVMTGFETQNKYLVRNTLGQQVYFAAECELK